MRKQLELEPEKFRPQYKVDKILRVGGKKLGSVGFPETTQIFQASVLTAFAGVTNAWDDGLRGQPDLVGRLDGDLVPSERLPVQNHHLRAAWVVDGNSLWTARRVEQLVLDDVVEATTTQLLLRQRLRVLHCVSPSQS